MQASDGIKPYSTAENMSNTYRKYIPEGVFLKTFPPIYRIGGAVIRIRITAEWVLTLPKTHNPFL